MNFSKKNHKQAFNKYGVSKKSILIIAMVVFSYLNVNAKTFTTNLDTTAICTTIATNDLIEVFDWTVKTTTGTFSGTASSLFDAKRRANIIGQGAVVLEQKITTYYVLKSEMHSKNNRMYFWEVNSEHGHAKGYSKEEFSAKQMINLVARGGIISYRIIASKNL